MVAGDIVGSSNLTEQDISVTVPVIVGPVEVGQTITQGCVGTSVDLSVGLKAAFAQSVVGFAAVFIPLITMTCAPMPCPTAGLEVSF